MNLIPDPSEKGEKGRNGVNSTLKAGLAAVKQGNYQEAIANLEAVCENELSEKAIVQAQMGLTVAYDRIGDGEKAIALAKELSNNPNSQVKEWAVRNLTSLKERYPDQFESLSEGISDTGFVPLNPTEQTSSRPKIPISSSTPTLFPPKKGNITDISSTTNSSGFTPFDTSSPSQAKREQAKSNNIPNTENTGLQSSSSQTQIPRPQSSASSQNKPSSTIPARSVQKLNNPVNSWQMPTDERPNETSAYQAEWKQAGRANKWQNLPNKIGFHFDLSQLWGVQAVSAIALLITVHWAIVSIVKFAINKVAEILVNLQLSYPNEDDYNDPSRWAPLIAWLLLIGLILSLPWLMDGLLKAYYGLKPLSLENLTARSPEAARVLQRFTRERRLPLPTLWLIPNSVPIAFTYGNLPRNARIVVTQGLLEQLADDEIAAVYAAELGHIVHRDFVVMSFGLLIAQIPYIFYQRISQLGDRWSNQVLKFITAAIAVFFYGLYWLLRCLLLWLSRARIYYSDRLSCEITGNPNGLTRALLKIAIGMAKDVEKQGKTSYLLEGFEVLSPVGYRQAISLGSLYSHTPLEPILAWDYLNPHRRWLTIDNSHPLMGERIQILSSYGRYWKIETELNFPPKNSLKPDNGRLFLQAAPYLGILLGLILGGILWGIGGISILLKIRQVLLDWMWGDRAILHGCLLIGIGIGILLRINLFFPDIKPSTVRDEPTLADLLTDPAALPLDSHPVRLQGKLLGRSGISNWLCQDLILQTASGLVKLHYFSWLGPLGNLLIGSPRPAELVNRSIALTGWFRRGATPWIDVETIRTQGGKTIQSGHPIWSTLLAFAAAFAGVYIIFRGDL
ncbi:MAG TPA: zinc metalloprotease HtpX [Leptolyngbyaceae cyanobacterium]